MDRHVQGAQMTTPGLDRDYRVRHSIRQAPNKWELYAEKKEHEFRIQFRIDCFSKGNLNNEKKNS